MFRKFKSINRKIPGLFKEDPAETFKRHVWINPFWEDDPYEIVDLMGADRVVFGSDWPHIEGLPNPRDYAMEIKELDAASQRLIMHDNAEDAQPAPARSRPGRNPSNIRRIVVGHRRRRSASPVSRGWPTRRRRWSRSSRRGRPDPSVTSRLDPRVVPAADARSTRPSPGTLRAPTNRPAARRRRGRSHSLSSALAGNGPKPVLGSGLGVGRDHVGGDAGVACPPTPSRSVRPMTPILAMPYTAPPGTPPNAAPDETFTKRPPPRSAITAHAGRLDVERATELRVDHRVELRLGELGERRHAHLTRVVDHDVDGAERVEGGVDDGAATLGRRDGVAVGDRLAAGGPDLLDHRVGGRIDSARRPHRRCR